jgi:hypothetical protein
MGWHWQHKDPGPLQDFFIRELRPLEVIATHSHARHEFYAAVRKPETGEIFAFVALLEWRMGDRHNFGYKPMDETMGPYAYNCPARILDLLTPTDNLTANEWRSRCCEVITRKAEHAAMRRKIWPGCRVRFAEGQFNIKDPEFIVELAEGARTKKTLRYRHVATGQLYQIPATAIVASIKQPGGPGRPRLPRDEHGNIIRESKRTQ